MAGNNHRKTQFSTCVLNQRAACTSLQGQEVGLTKVPQSRQRGHQGRPPPLDRAAAVLGGLGRENYGGDAGADRKPDAEHDAFRSEAIRAMACPKCGSWAVRADRSLSGRMVCARCGHPLGQRVSDQSRRSSAGRGRGWRQRRWLLWAGLTALVALSAVLAAKQPGENQGGARREPAGSSGLSVPIR
jgi:hypothetical protein